MSAPATERPLRSAAATRLVSLDVFRGATMALMILVNTAGGWPQVFSQLRHASWNGWTLTDTVFPSFLWITGVAMTLSFARRRERGGGRGQLLVHTLRRAAVLFVLGLIVYEYPYFDLKHLRMPGVLQRIAVCYFLGATLFLYCSRRALVWWTTGLLAVYWLLVKVAPVPGYGAGILNSPEGSLPQYLDLLTMRGFLMSPRWDPEGILSTLPALASTLLGILAGYLLRSKREPVEKAAWLFTAGNTLIVAGAVVNIWLPINKNLWSSSFTLLMAGISTCAFAFCYWLLDAQGRGRSLTRPFAIFGMNAIAIYVIAELGDTTLAVIKVGGVSLNRVLFAQYTAAFGGKFDSLLWGVSFDAVMFAIAWVMYRRKWFIKV